MTTSKRSIPYDFRDVAKGKSTHYLRKHYKAGIDTIRDWLIRSGITTGRERLKLSVPENWAELCKAMTRPEIARHLGCSVKPVDRWTEETGIRPKVYIQVYQQNNDLPDGFLQVMPTITMAEGCKRFGMSQKRMSRLMKLHGIEPKKHVPMIKAINGERKPNKGQWKSRKPMQIVAMTSSANCLTSKSAEYLQRFQACFRANERGAPCHKSETWRFGNAIKTSAEIEAIAVRKGYDPDAWKRLA